MFQVIRNVAANGVIFVLLGSSLAWAESNYFEYPSGSFSFIEPYHEPLKYNIDQCPTINPNHQELLSQLTNMKERVLNEASNCKDSDNKTSDLGTSLDGLLSLAQSSERNRFIELVGNFRGRVLSPEEADFVRRYVEKGTKAVGLLFTSIAKSQCLDEDKKSMTMNDVASFLFELTKLSSEVAGPYGAPLSIIGSSISGLLSGLATLKETQGAYNFDQQDQIIAYNHSLCAYAQLRQGLQTQLNDDTRINEYRYLISTLEERAQYLTQNCQACEKFLSSLKGIIDKPTSDNAIKDFVNNHQSTLNQIYQTDGTTTQEKVVELIKIANSLLWASSQLNELQKLKPELHNSIGLSFITNLQFQLDNFFYEQEGAHFIETWQKRAQHAFHVYDSETKRWKRKFSLVLNDVSRKDPSFSIARDDYKILAISSNHRLLKTTLQKYKSAIDKKVNHFDLIMNIGYRKLETRFQQVIIEMQVVDQFCHYFDQSLLSLQAMMNCQSTSYRQLTSTVLAIWQSPNGEEPMGGGRPPVLPSDDKPSTKSWIDGLRWYQQEWPRR